MHLNSDLIFRYLFYPQFSRTLQLHKKHVEMQAQPGSSVQLELAVTRVFEERSFLQISLDFPYNMETTEFLTLCDFLLQIYSLGVIRLCLLFSYLPKRKPLLRQFAGLILSSVIFVVISRGLGQTILSPSCGFISAQGICVHKVCCLGNSWAITSLIL